MVKFRGIEICVISQFDICKLPEFLHSPDSRPYESHQSPQPSPQYPLASCYIPIYPGSQIWFEYHIEGPHPPGAAYFFKLFVNGREVTAWDCTGKTDFGGKMMYTLTHEGQHPVHGTTAIRRQALKFGDDLPHSQQSKADFGEDCIQINVHRIEHRKRIKEMEEGLGRVDMQSIRPDGLRLVNGGLLDGGTRPKRYMYQLLDPKDAPYAAFRFFCRPYEDLGDESVIPLLPYLSSSITSSPGASSNAETPSAQTFHAMTNDTTESPILASETSIEPSQSALQSGCSDQTPPKPDLISDHVLMSDSDDSLSVRTKDSIEELSPNVPRSPRSPRSKSPKKKSRERSEVPPSPTRAPLAKYRLKKRLTLNINGADFDLEKRKRPLSPFTAGGMLRKAIVPQTAPASVTEFGPSIEDEVKSLLAGNKGEQLSVEQSALRTTSLERGGKTLMGLLGRRVATAKGS